MGMQPNHNPDSLPARPITKGTSEEIPLTWLSGSEQELRRLTHAICCTAPSLVSIPASVTVLYRAAIPGKRGGVLSIANECHCGDIRRARSLCELAFRLNPFTGLVWRRDPFTRRQPEG